MTNINNDDFSLNIELHKEIETRQDLIIKLKDLLLAIYIVLENDYSYTEEAVENGFNYGIESLFDAPKYMTCHNIVSLNIIYKELLDYLQVTPEQLLIELMEESSDDGI